MALMDPRAASVSISAAWMTIAADLRPGDYTTTPAAGSASVGILDLGCLQDFFGRLADRNVIRCPHEGYYRASVMSFISEERNSIGDIYVDGLSTFVTALDPGHHVAFLVKWPLFF